MHWNQVVTLNWNWVVNITGICNRENNRYFYNYECMEEWIIDDLENEESEEENSMISEFNKAIYYGDTMLRKIFNPYHLNNFQKRVNNYKSNTIFEKDCLSVAKKALELLQEYPSDTIFSNTSNQEFESDDGLIKAEQYKLPEFVFWTVTLC
jgi:hypothetical protein